MTAALKLPVKNQLFAVHIIWKGRVVEVMHSTAREPIDLPMGLGRFQLTHLELEKDESRNFKILDSVELLISRSKPVPEIAESRKASSAELVFLAILFLLTGLTSLFWVYRSEPELMSEETRPKRMAHFIFPENPFQTEELQNGLPSLPPRLSSRPLRKLLPRASEKLGLIGAFSPLKLKNVSDSSRATTVLARNGNAVALSTPQLQAVNLVRESGQSVDPSSKWKSKSGSASVNALSGLGLKTGTSISLPLDEMAVNGGIDRDGIRQVILSNSKQLKSCYEKGLSSNQSLHGKVVLEWQINESGSVPQAKVKQSTIESAAVESCLLAALRGWRFPPAPAGQIAEVTYPMIFLSDSH
jgi:TonB family protein